MHTTILQNQAAAVHRKNQREITGKDEVTEGTTAPQPVEEAPAHVDPVLVPIEQVEAVTPVGEPPAAIPTEVIEQPKVEVKPTTKLAKKPKEPKVSEPKAAKIAKAKK